MVHQGEDILAVAPPTPDAQIEENLEVKPSKLCRHRCEHTEPMDNTADERLSTAVAKVESAALHFLFRCKI